MWSPKKVSTGSSATRFLPTPRCCMQREGLYLVDIVEAARKIASYLEGVSPEVWAADSMRRDAVIWQLSIIGEAVGGISDETRASTPEIPWKLIRGLRNNVVHRYFSVDWKIVHSAATVNVPVGAASARSASACPSGSLQAPGARGITRLCRFLRR
ncbi:HepT-like ribonuclease domain-containing protein [Streptosporangium roseum]|uniref:HepT-like ribonuclease domain-containing protein n=1 Tax=Streptosporangium roseum TaxID=2001 RepID=UPI00331A8D3C